jgi:hypothetical protein
MRLRLLGSEALPKPYAGSAARWVLFPLQLYFTSTRGIYKRWENVVAVND